MIASERLCRTVDGRIVPDGHVDSAFLVVGVGSVVPAEFEAAVSAYLAGVKQAEQPVNKAVEAPAADKARKAPARKSAPRK